MTLGPTEPCSTGKSQDLPDSLSVSVIVPLGAPTFVLFPLMDAPRFCARRRLSHIWRQDIPPAGHYQMAPQYCNAISQLRDHLTLAISVTRPTVSARPRMSITSKMPGEASEPVRAARSG